MTTNKAVEKKTTIVVHPDVHIEIRKRVAAAGGKIGEYVDALLRKALKLSVK